MIRRIEDFLEKRITPGDGDYLSEGEDRAVPLISNMGRLEVDDRLSRGKVKTAAAEDAIAEALKIKPHPGRVYILVIGLGAEEFWGTNNNGDSFPENALLGLPPRNLEMAFFDRYRHRLPKEWGYKTFLKGHTFEEHRNSNPRLAIGGIAGTFWNNRMHRVENLIWLDRKNQRAKKWVDRADRGEIVPTSMACRVPFDRCSICGNLAPTKAQYCAHLRPGSVEYQLRQIREDGRSVSMINDFPDFFDESCVETPAAPEALSIMKVASEQKEAKKKQAEIEKQDPDLPLDVALDDLAELYHAEPVISRPILDRLKPLGMQNVTKAAADLGMCLKPSEVFYLYFGDKIPTKTASDIDRKVLRVEPRETDFASIYKVSHMPIFSSIDLVKVARATDLLMPYATSRSYQEPFLTPRLMRKKASVVAPEAISEADEKLVAVYHTIYKAARGEYGYGVKQAKLTWECLSGGL